MNLKIFDDAKTFYERIKQNFSDKQMENDLMLGLAYLLIDDPNHYGSQPFLASIEEDGKIFLCAFMTPPWNILVHGIEECPDLSYKILIDYILKERISIPGVNGRADISKKFMDIWCNKTQNKSELHMESRLFILTEVNKITNSSGHLVKADMSHFRLLNEWAKQFHVEVRLDVEDDYIRKHVKYIIQSGNAFLWIDKEPVCMTFCERPHENGISISYVFTPPKFRNKGYALSCVATVSQRILGSGFAYCSLFTDLTNPTSNSIYQKIGYRPACDYIHYNFKQ